MLRRIGTIVILAFFCVVAGRSETLADDDDRTQSDNLTAYSSIAPPFITPAKDLFVTREGDSFVVVVTATCLLEDESDTQFELLPSAPGFVHLSSAYRNETRGTEYAEGLGVVQIAPQIGDAGKYVVSVRVKACTGKVERVITFKVHVKQSQTSAAGLTVNSVILQSAICNLQSEF
ncbi:MAG: hypothetical protein AABO57_09955 [Acidobacteriota bacterium]